MLEYWSAGVFVENLDIFLQHSKTPSLQYSTIDKPMASNQPWNYFIIDYSAENRLFVSQDDFRRKPQLLMVFSWFDLKAVLLQSVG